MRKKIIIVTVLMVLTGLCAPVIRNMIRYKMNPLEAALVSLADVTRWAPSYSDRSFKSVDLGSSPDQVRVILGPALYTNVYEGETTWHYTVGPNGNPQSSSDGSTHVRGIWFDQDMKVKKKLYYFYFD